MTFRLGPRVPGLGAGVGIAFSPCYVRETKLEAVGTDSRTGQAGRPPDSR